MDALVERITLACLARKVISQKEAEVFRYGLDLLVFSILSIGSFLFLGYWMGKIVVFVCILLPFILLQSFGGGYHAQTHLRCYCSMLISIVSCAYAVETLPILVSLCVAVLATAVIFRYAPVQHKKAPFSEAFRIKSRRIVRVVALACLVCAWGIQGISPTLASALAMGMAASGVSIAYAVYSRHRLQR